jgi:ATPase subunit of ABC transporter with duplicated ATPase domains
MALLVITHNPRLAEKIGTRIVEFEEINNEQIREQ